MLILFALERLSFPFPERYRRKIFQSVRVNQPIPDAVDEDDEDDDTDFDYETSSNLSCKFLYLMYMNLSPYDFLIVVEMPELDDDDISTEPEDNLPTPIRTRKSHQIPLIDLLFICTIYP